MARPLLVLSLILTANFGAAQKLVEKTVLSPKTTSVLIHGENCFKIDLTTHTGDQLQVEATMEGEYAKDLAVKLEQNGDNFQISTDFLPSFNRPNDKLSAHKVISIALKISIPEYVKTDVFGTHTNVFAMGNYRSLNITLADGNCKLGSITENVNVRTQKGEILVGNAKGSVTAESKYGKVFMGNVPHGYEVFTLYSVEGDILINIPRG